VLYDLLLEIIIIIMMMLLQCNDRTRTSVGSVKIHEKGFQQYSFINYTSNVSYHVDDDDGGEDDVMAIGQSY
jgi:hypothetical protein